MALEREKNLLVLEKCQNILKDLLTDEDNKYCVDCDAKSPRWASWNIGIFLCIRCAGIHRNLGVHISKVKSVNLDTWTPQQVACIQQMGNSRARAVYEANLQDNFRRPQTDSTLEQFIRAKYEAKKYIAREWVPPPLPNPLWDVEIEKQLKKKKERKSSGGNVEFPAAPVKNHISKSGGVSPKPLPKAPGGRNNSPNQSKRPAGSALNSNQKDSASEKESSSSAAIDLLGLDMHTTTNGTDIDGDIFGDFLTAPAAPSLSSNPATEEGNKANSTQSEESNFFNQKVPDASAEKLSKDSILALYSQTPSHPQPQPPLYGGSGGGGGMFMGGPGMLTAVPHSGIGLTLQQQQQQQQHQNMMLYQQQKALAGVQNSLGGAQNSFYPQGMPVVGGPVYAGMVGGVPQGISCSSGGGGGGVGVQLSAANPFAQLQSQMGTLNLGGMIPAVQSQQSIANPLLMGNVMANSGMSSNPSHNNTFSNNLWQ